MRAQIWCRFGRPGGSESAGVAPATSSLRYRGPAEDALKLGCENGELFLRGPLAPRWPHRFSLALLVVLALVWLHGCAARQQDGEPVSIELLAVLPIEPVQIRREDAVPQHDETPAPLPADAGMAVTAQIYRVLADQTSFRFVPDMNVLQAFDSAAVRRAPDDPRGRALALGREVGADGVIFGRVYRFRDRVGTEFGAAQPASVWFDLELLAVATGEVIWNGEFARTQEPLSANLLNFWMVWRAGSAGWLTARQLAGVGVDQLFGQMSGAVQP